jgi:hypothetical protein
MDKSSIDKDTNELSTGGRYSGSAQHVISGPDYLSTMLMLDSARFLHTSSLTLAHRYRINMVEHHQTDPQSLHSAVSAGKDKPSRDGLAVAGHKVRSRTQSARINTLKALLPAGISLLLVFWISSMWLFGSTYKMDQRVNRLKVSGQ